MIAYLQGKIFKKNKDALILLVGGVGYELHMNQKDLADARMDEEATLYVYTHVKEDALQLFGFRSEEDLNFFKQAISVSGVGPKSGLNILALAPVAEIKKAISSGDPSMLQKVSGIGKKTAERLVVELKEKFINDISESPVFAMGDEQVVSALLSLGYKELEAKEMAGNVGTGDLDLASKIKEALKYAKS